MATKNNSAIFNLYMTVCNTQCYMILLLFRKTNQEKNKEQKKKKVFGFYACWPDTLETGFEIVDN